MGGGYEGRMNVEVVEMLNTEDLVNRVSLQQIKRTQNNEPFCSKLSIWVNMMTTCRLDQNILHNAMNTSLP